MSAEWRWRVTSLNLEVPASFDASQYELGFLDCRYTMLACGHLLIQEKSKVLLCLSALNDFFSQSVAMVGFPQPDTAPGTWPFWAYKMLMGLLPMLDHDPSGWHPFLLLCQLLILSLLLPMRRDQPSGSCR